MRFSRKSITWSALPTFLDAGILIAVVRGQAKEAARALAILEDPERCFLTSDVLRIEVLSKAISYQRSAGVALYACYVARDEDVSHVLGSLRWLVQTHTDW